MFNDGMKTSASEEWATPQDFYDRLNDEFHFTLDPCSTDENAKCEKHYTKEQNGLRQDWTGETVFCNPPYGRDIWKWCRKCYEHSLRGGVAVMLIHARTDTEWFHDFVYHKAELRFIRGRLHFNGSKWNAPFPSMIAVYRPDRGKQHGREQKAKGFYQRLLVHQVREKGDSCGAAARTHQGKRTQESALLHPLQNEDQPH